MTKQEAAVKFFEEFTIQAVSLASQVVTMEESGELSYADIEVFGSTQQVLIHHDNEELFTLENEEEREVIETCLEEFRAVEANVELFLERLNAIYGNSVSEFNGLYKTTEN